jgi:predicted SAM-dependent methyltransferase
MTRLVLGAVGPASLLSLPYRGLKAVVPRPFKLALKRLVRSHIDAQPEPLKEAILALKNELAIARASRDSLSDFHALHPKKYLKVHLGCGEDVRPGWVNIDLAPTSTHTSPRCPDTIIINYDLRLGLPLAPDSCHVIYSSHFFEHLTYKHGVQLLRDCYSALSPGGMFRAALPDFQGLFEAYIRGEREYVRLLQNNVYPADAVSEFDLDVRTLVDYVNYGVYQDGEHKCIYDREKFALLLRRIGFSSVTPSSYQHGLDPATPVRRRHSFYIEAIK